MKKYMARNLAGFKIEAVEVERETPDSVWIKGRRSKRRSSYENYFDSFDEAKAYCVAEAESKVAVVRHQLEYANSHLSNAKGMKEPA